MTRDDFPEQQALLQAVLGAGDASALLQWLPQGRAAQRLNERGLLVYRANGHALAERALAAAYPVLFQFMGEENFAMLARHFWSAHPPSRGDMACWGEDLAGFVDAAPQLADEPCLGDVARLEWLMHATATAADVEADFPSFALLASEDAAPLSLALGAGVALLASASPVVSIVNAHLLGQPSLQEAGQRLAAGCAEHALVWRQGFKPCVRPSSAAEHKLIETLLAGRALAEALDGVDRLGEEAAAFDFNIWLAAAVQTGLVCGACPCQ
ncbi:putative DNA-binding domain-containing protein [Polaromonas sp. YR568]|uniref:HvfC/BufC family peptide modification chaperone n=1 Tax=Polaromonas sp. YR568 TaxID=1855301 RepID=UPI0031382AB0